MKWTSSLLLIGTLLFATSSEAALFPKNSKVTILDQNNFEREVLSIEKPTLVAFTAPWCGHCQNLVPDYLKVASQLDGVVKLASIDCDNDKNKPLCSKYGIQGFPTLKLFPATKKRLPRDYQGPRSAKDIAAFMVDALPMGAKKLKAEELESYAAGEQTTPKVILFSKKPTSSPLYKSLALDFRKSLSFAFLRGDQRPVQAAARIHLGVHVSEDKLPLLIVVPSRSDGEDFDKDGIKVYTGPLKYHELNAWIKDTIPEAKTGKVKKPATKARPKKKTVKLDENIDEVPKGANREWRVEENMTEEERQKKMEDLAEMLNTAIKQGEELRVDGSASEASEQKEANEGKKASKAASDTDSSASGDSSSHSYSSSSSYSSNTDEDGKTTTDRSASYSTSGDDPSDASSYKLNSHTTTTTSDSEDISLKENLQRWLEGEQVDWNSDYSTQFTDAQAAAEKLLKEDPDKAEQMALESEKWLAHYLVSDVELMKIAREKGNQDPALSDDKLERVEKMYQELLKRIEERENKIKQKAPKDHQDQTKSHDEL
ncbi:related to MPD1 - Disulfide isomerase related protein [Melanopsichium pennsylvanicum]|uniref:Related to MPD1 - Disulfide isomerase related protein n=2 Tax=Melanopsichium pennsylvanicum TaxID=63383 RepID=A0AAJ4XQP7_9BASI|nr:related to MPD1-Disulfide isomerase related protein [Melanopsichium pennsylvanicum 4]SNX87429.1 related to MPD1 - Disulfide isomerase related protein [Melanopsichium pennsylvanicum]